jgi:hypothetical protein
MVRGGPLISRFRMASNLSWSVWSSGIVFSLLVFQVLAVSILHGHLMLALLALLCTISLPMKQTTNNNQRKVIVPNSAQSAELQSLTKERKDKVEHLTDLRNSEDGWSRANRLFGFGAVASGALFGIAAFFSQRNAGRVSLKQRPVETRIAAIDGRMAEIHDQEAQAAIARVQKDTETERMARVEAEESVEWRRISPRQEEQLKNRLATFDVAKTWFVYDMYNVEAFNFGSQIASALSKPLRWNPTEPEPVMSMREGPVPLGTNPPLETGITISTTGKPSDEEAANALVTTLISLGFDCRRSPKPALNLAVNDPQSGPIVFVFINLRPEGRQGEAKLEADARMRQTKTPATTNE